MLSAIADGTPNHDAPKNTPANSTRRREKAKDAEQKENVNASPSGHPLRLDVLEDKRLKSTEGMLVGYEWVDISQPGEAGERHCISRSASLTIVCRPRSAVIRVHDALERSDDAAGLAEGDP